MSNVIEFTIRAVDDFTATLNKSTQGFSRMEKSLAGLAAAAGVYAAVRMAKASLDNAEAMGLAAQKAGATVESFSAMSWAAKMSNVEMGELTTGLRFLSRAMSEGETSQGGKALQALGVAAKDANGNLRTSTDVLLDVADAFSKAKDDANKTANAMAIFGRSGNQLVPMLNQGSAAIREMMRNAEDLGLVISTDFAAAADQVNDNLATMGAVMQGQVNKAMAQLAPTIEAISGQFVLLAQDTGTVTQASAVMASGMKLLVTAGVAIVTTFNAVGTSIGIIAAALVQAAQGEFKAAWNTIKTGHADVVDSVGSAMLRVDAIWSNTVPSVAANALKAASNARKLGESMQPVKEGMNDAADAAKALKEQVRQQQEAFASAFNVYESGSRRFNAVMEEASAIIEGQMTPLEEYQAKIERINEMLQQGVFTQDEYNQAIMRAQDAFGNVGAEMEEYRVTATDVFAETSRQVQEYFGELGNTVYQMSTAFAGASTDAVRGIGDAMAATVVEGKSLAVGLENVAKGVLKTVISTLVQIGAQRLLLHLLDLGATRTENASKLGAGLSEVWVNSFASAAAIPMVGWQIAPGVAAANLGVAAGGIAAAQGIGTGMGMGGVAHGGLDFVPAETTYLLDRGERVLSPRQNEDLTSFLNDGSSSQVVIENINIHILENAVNAEVYSRMDKISLRNALGQPVIDALNEMFSLGVRPNFASQVR